MFYGHIVDPYKPYSHEDLVSDSARLAYSHPSLLHVSSIGLSVEGRKIIGLTVGKGQRKILLCGTHHGREYLSAAYLMKMAEEYSVYYQNHLKPGGFDVRTIFNEVTLHLVPMVNPDGAAICLRGLQHKPQPLRLKTMNLIGGGYAEWKANANGVDLNRNYPCLWEKLDTGVFAPASQGFKGYAPATEPEVKAMTGLCAENEYLLSATFHTKGEEIYYADSLTGVLPHSCHIAKKLSALTGYIVAEISKNPAVFAGGFENWFRMVCKKPSFLIELTPYDGTGLPHDDRQFYTLVWKKASLIGLLLADVSLRP